MKRRMIALGIAICMIFTLFAFSPDIVSGQKLVSEAKAKEAGLAFINLIYSVAETDAVVALYEHQGAAYIEGNWQPSDTAESVYVYQVAVMSKTTNDYLYAASVNAKTGEAYRGNRNTSLLPEITEEQRALAIAAGATEQPRNCDFSIVSADCYRTAREWIEITLQPDVPILGFIDRGFSMDDPFPEVSMGFYAVMYDGTIYNFDMVWPQMQIYNFEILNQIEITMEDA